MALRAQRAPRRGFSWTISAIAFALVVATLAVYAPVRHFGFVDFDDPLYVSENPHLAGGLTAANIAWAFTAGYATNWHPLTWLSHLLDVQLFGLNAAPQHVVNLVLHVANSLLLFWLLRRMTRALWPSAFVAALFALHPLHVESVAWISERKDVLSTLFWLLTMWAYVSYAARPRWTRYLVVMTLFAFGLMAKPMLVTLPFVLVLMDVWPLDRIRLGWPHLILEKLPLVLLAALSTVITYLVQLYGGAVPTLESISLGRRVANALVSYATYMKEMIWPSRLAIFYPFPPDIAAWKAIVAFIVLVAVSIAAFRARRRFPYVAVGWSWFVVTLLPVIGIVQVGRQALADRYTYVPYIGLFVIIAWGVPDLLARVPQRKAILTALAGAALIGCSAVTRTQVGYWANSSTVWYHALDVVPDNDRAHNGVGMLLYNSGNTSEAMSHFTEALRIDPTFAAAHHNLGLALAKEGQTDAAIAHYREAIRFKPDMADAYHNLGLALALRGQFNEAIELYRTAIHIKPELAEAHGNLGGALASEDKFDEAMSEYQEALRLKPTLVEVHSSMARALMDKGRLPEAIDHYREAIRLRPEFADAHNGLGFALGNQGKTDEAVAEYSEALRLRPNSAEAHYNRGFALATQRHVNEAITDFSEAIRLKPDFEAAHMALGMALGAAGRMDEAKREFAKVKGPGAR